MTINQNVSPYYDDFDSSKKFYKVLFRPGRAVQARELTQIQSILQNQITNFGDHVFQQGAMVLPGQIAFDSNYTYVKIQNTYNGTNVDVSHFVGKTVTGQSSGVTATCVAVVDVQGSDPKTLYIKYNNSGSNNITKTFNSGEQIWTNDGSPYKCTANVTSATGVGSAASISDGVYYVNGYLAAVDDQTIILDKYDNTPTFRVGLTITESIVTANDDSSLNDNAQGTPNYLAPGADRYKIDLIVTKEGLTDPTDQNFVELLRLVNGVVQSKVDTSAYSVLNDTLARRTFDEAGNFTVSPFGIDIRENFNNGTNRGVYTSLQGGDATKLALGLEPGKAYVGGYEVTNVATTFINADKARDSAQVVNGSTPVTTGNYIYVYRLYGFPSPTTFPQVSLRNAAVSVDGTAPGAEIGTARVIGIEYVYGTIGTTNATYKLYLRGITTTGGNTLENNVKGIYLAGSPAFTATCVQDTASLTDLFEPGNRATIYPLPQPTLRTVRAADASVQTNYAVRRIFTGTTDGSGNVSFNTGTNETFVAFNTTDYILSITSGGAAGTIVDLSGKATLSGSPLGSSITLALTGTYASVGVQFMGTVFKSVAQEKTKTLQSGTVAFTSPTTTMSLARSDVLTLTGIYDSQNAGVDATTSNLNITSRYTLDTGQRDAHYGVGSVTLIPGAPTPTGRVLITFQYFSHGSGDYFSVDSYTGQITYDQIPSYTSAAGQLYQLRDCLDFRPCIANDGSGFTSTGASLIEEPKPYSSVISNFQYYLNRIDRVYVDTKGNFGVAKGVSALNPVAPDDLPNTMKLYTLYVPAYTFNTSSVQAELIDNKGYTMRAIGSLETRIANLEYYTSLSLLENNTSNSQIISTSTGLDRFKNGFVVDGFNGHSVGDVTAIDYRCSIDTVNHVCRPSFASNSVGLSFTSGLSSNVQLTGELITLPYTSTVTISQLYASKTVNVNPYSVFAYLGTATLTPSYDNWKDTVTAPDLNVTLPDNVNQLLGLAGTSWNDWQTNWTGVPITATTQTSQKEYGSNFGGPHPGSYWPYRYDTTTTNITATLVGQSRTGVVTTVDPQTVTTDLGNSLVDSTVIPFMRSIPIQFAVTRMRPSTRLYPFFDGVDVSSYCTPTGGSLGGSIITDATGAASGSFTVPNTATVKFRTGSRVFKLTDSSTNGTDSTTNASTTFTAQGLLNTSQDTVLSTRIAQVNQQQVTQNQTITQASITQTTTTGAWTDPLAQTFQLLEPQGAFLTSIDLYFSTKAAALPVTVQLRNVVNGYPGPSIVPFSEVTLYPASVNTSTDGTVATTFTFISPVYLQPTTDYCFVIMADTTEYNVYVGTIGDVQLGTDRLISEQPYAGVMFKSQNASTWTADQNSDITFQLHKAVFSTGSLGTAVFNNQALGTTPLITNAITTTNASAVVRVYHPSHGMSNGSSVAISGIAAGTYNGITAAQLNGTFVISAVEWNYYSYTAGATANATGSVGGTGILATYDMMLDVFQPNAQTIVLPNTSIGWKAKSATAKSIHGTQTPYIADTTYSAIAIGDNNYPASPHLVASSINETASMSGNKSFALQGTLASTNPDISPVIDTVGLSLIGISNIVDNANSGNVANWVAETNPTNGSAMAKYLTRQITLQNTSIGIQLYVAANIPPAATMDVYVKTLPADSTSPMDTLNWVLVTPSTPITKTTNMSQFTEYSFLADSLDPFIAFKVKIVMRTTDSTQIVRISDMRAIALGT